MKSTSHLMMSTLVVMLGMLISTFAQDHHHDDPIDAPPEIDDSRFLGPPEHDHIGLPDDLQAKMRTFRENRRTLRHELRTRLRDLEDRTKEEIDRVRQEFQAEFADEIEAQHQLADEIHHELRHIREERRNDRLDRPQPSAAAHQLRRDFREARRTLRQAQREFHQQLEGITDEEERRRLIREFRQEHRDTMHDLKEIRRDIRRRARDHAAGDLDGTRRPDDRVRD